MLNRFACLKKIRIVNNNNLFTQKKLFSNKDDKDKDTNVEKIQLVFTGICGAIGTITGFKTEKTMCGPTISDKVSYVISMGFMGAAVGYVSFVMFPVLIPLGLATSILIDKLDKNNPKKEK
jgi:hypothetical protein